MKMISMIVPLVKLNLVSLKGSIDANIAAKYSALIVFRKCTSRPNLRTHKLRKPCHTLEVEKFY